MKPKRIIIIRHGESEGNIDKNIYATKPDHALNLTENGRKQALDAGLKLKELIGEETVHAYVSPYERTLQTFAEIKKNINCVDEQESPELREQEWGHLRAPDVTEKLEEERKKFGYFLYRFQDGESGADVYDRMAIFLGSLHRDFDHADYPDNTLLVTHGLTMRLFVMRWFKISMKTFETWRNPKNCQFLVMRHVGRMMKDAASTGVKVDFDASHYPKTDCFYCENTPETIFETY